MFTEPQPLLVVAVTGRALAASAARGGRPVIVLDCFADRDTRLLAADCRSVVASRGLRIDRHALLEAATALAPAGRSAGLVYGSGFEGRTSLLERLARGRRLYGNTPAVVASVRNPRIFFPLLRRLGVKHPDVRLQAPLDLSGWLVKHSGGAGGAQVRYARRRRVRTGSYFQRFEEGRVLSVLFLADARRALVLGFNEQWTAAARPGSPFLYGGAAGGVMLPVAVESDLRLRLDALIAATGLVGLNGIDFLLRGDEWSVLEVNPRPPATIELYDNDYPLGLLEWHLRACRGELPDHAAPVQAVRAHAVVHAVTACRVAPSFQFPEWCRDVPNPGTRIAQGAPVCTVHAEAGNREIALSLLRQRRTVLERAMIGEAA
jgi:predicted ATP-grasp superfamily ATP-dependent carboligase